ncbi:type VI lipase adapter Tla3 domain-containing protein [Pseudoduganella aquatica]|uniref:DUF2875 domain-containing protein n=1 Tax=Pseudoduganella aquatica TaxID=2660641 RepID=A0A7X4HHN4_9BURK|nr:DUF2875 family protein [Pseudoduganella aquatica]MYN10958.1 DUF2875 domain-containing protein [Pseudoduganella aquatica]
MSKAVMIFWICLGVLIFCIYKIYENTHSKSSLTPAKLSAVVSPKAADAPGGKEYVLEVIGLGVTLDKYRQKALWQALVDGNAYTTIREMDPKKYPWSGDDKDGLSGGHEAASLENGAFQSPQFWGTPVFNAEPLCRAPEYTDRPELPQGGMVGGSSMSGMITHLFVIADRELSERPDRIVGRIFEFFDKNPDVPYVVLTSEDSTSTRIMYSQLRTDRIRKDEYSVPEMPDSSALFILARRERVDSMRPFVFEDVSDGKSVGFQNQHGIARRLYLAYLDLQKSVPQPSGSIGREPTSEEWLAETAKFAVRPEIRGTGAISVLDATSLWKHHPPRDWKPTPWFPVPWNTDQLERFDALPSLGFIHRPVFVKMTDHEGKVIKHQVDREAALHAGWQEALQTLPQAERAAGPARVIFSTANNQKQLITFHGLLRQIKADGGPEIDPAKSNQFIDTDRRLGNTGVATFFMQMAIGVIGSYQEGGVSAAFNLRDPSEASIILVTPPSEEKRKSQYHSIGTRILENTTLPPIDPKNYERP